MGKKINKKLARTKNEEEKNDNKRNVKKGLKSLKRKIDKNEKNVINNDSKRNSNKSKVTNRETVKHDNNSLNSSFFDKNSEEKIDNDTFSSLDQYIINTTFNFLNEKKKNWIHYLNLQDKKDEKKWQILNESANQFIKTKKTEIDILIELVVSLDNQRRLSGFSDKELKIEFFKEPVAKIWNLNDFDGFIIEGWRKYNIGFQYKKRYLEKIKKTININWENILYFIGYYFKLENENIWDYLWYLFYLPKRLLILWLARLNLIEKEEHWWINLLREWNFYFFEVLRCQGIKNWLSIFLKDNCNKKENNQKAKPLKIDDNFFGIN